MKIKSIKNKITYTVIGLILFFGTLSAFATYLISKNILSDLKRDDFLESTAMLAHEAGSIFFESRDLVESIAKSKNALNFLESYSESDQEDKTDTIPDSRILNDYNLGDMYSAIYLMDKDGNTLLSTNESFVGKNYSFRDYYKEAILGKPYQDVLIGITSKKLGYYFSYPVKSENGEIIGVAVIKQLPEYINQSISNELNNAETVMLADSFGVIIHSSNPDKVFKSLGKFSLKTERFLQNTKRYADLDIQPLAYDEVLLSIDSLDQPKSFITEDIIDGEEEILTLAQIGDLPFYVVGETHLNEVESFAVNTALTISAFVLVAAFFAAVFISIVSNKILRPISELNSTAQDISQGNFSERVDISSGDELEELAHSFNKMTDKLTSAKDNIEQKIKERTTQLEKLNKSMVGRELKMIELKKEVARLLKKK